MRKPIRFDVQASLGGQSVSEPGPVIQERRFTTLGSVVDRIEGQPVNRVWTHSQFVQDAIPSEGYDAPTEKAPMRRIVWVEYVFVDGVVEDPA